MTPRQARIARPIRFGDRVRITCTRGMYRTVEGWVESIEERPHLNLVWLCGETGLSANYAIRETDAVEVLS